MINQNSLINYISQLYLKAKTFSLIFPALSLPPFFSCHLFSCDFLCSLSLRCLFLHSHHFSDISQPTPPFVLFLPALHLLLFSTLITLPQRLVERSSIKDGENPALVFSLTHAFLSRPVSLFVWTEPCVSLFICFLPPFFTSISPSQSSGWSARSSPLLCLCS